MPKTTLNKDSPLDEAAKRVYGYFCSSFSPEKICKIMGYSEGTHSNRKRKPEYFTLRELRIIYNEAKLPDDVFMRMIREESEK